MVNLRSHTQEDGLPTRIIDLFGMFECLQDVFLGIFLLIGRHIDACQRVHTRRDAVVVAALHFDIDALLGIVGGFLEIAEAHIDAAQRVQTIGLAQRAFRKQGKRLQGVFFGLLEFLLGVEPFRRPPPNLLSQRICRCFLAENDFFIHELGFQQFVEEGIGRCRTGLLVKNFQLRLDILRRHRYRCNEGNQQGQNRSERSIVEGGLHYSLSYFFYDMDYQLMSWLRGFRSYSRAKILLFLEMANLLQKKSEPFNDPDFSYRLH